MHFVPLTRWRGAFCLHTILAALLSGVSCSEAHSPTVPTYSGTILYTVSGTVRGVDGAPVPDAEVLFHAGNGEKSGLPGFNTISDARGGYSGRVPPGQNRYGILARKPGF